MVHNHDTNFKTRRRWTSWGTKFIHIFIFFFVHQEKKQKTKKITTFYFVIFPVRKNNNFKFTGRSDRVVK